MADSVIGLQMYTLRDFMGNAYDTADTFKKVADIGYRNVELAGYGGMEVANLAKLLSDLGLQVCSSHVGFDTLRDTPEVVAEELHTLGCEWVVCGRDQSYTTEGGWVHFAQELSGIAQRLSELGLKYAYHNHSFEMERFNKRTIFDVLLEESDPDYVNFQIDTYWVQHGGCNPEALIRRVGSRAGMIHLKDMRMHGMEQFYAEVGEGNLNWAEIMAAGKDAGAQWYIVEQDTCERNPFESITISINNLKKMGFE